MKREGFGSCIEASGRPRQYHGDIAKITERRNTLTAYTIALRMAYFMSHPIICILLADRKLPGFGGGCGEQVKRCGAPSSLLQKSSPCDSDVGDSSHKNAYA